jgi:hypothetical protein
MSHWLPIYLPGYVACNHCRAPNPQRSEAPLCRNLNLCLTARGTSSSSLQFAGNRDIAEQTECQVAEGAHDKYLRYCQPRRWSWSGPDTFANSMRITPCPELIIVDVEHNLKSRTYAPSVHRILRNLSTSAVLMSPFAILHPYMTIVCKHTPREVAWMQLIVTKYLADPQLGYFQFPCDILFSFPLLLFHSCSYGIFIRRCPYSTWATCIHVWSVIFSVLRRRCSNRPQNISLWMTPTRIIWRLFPRCITSSTVTGTECRDVRRVWSFNHNSLLKLHCVSAAHIRKLGRRDK